MKYLTNCELILNFFNCVILDIKKAIISFSRSGLLFEWLEENWQDLNNLFFTLARHVCEAMLGMCLVKCYSNYERFPVQF